jgi:hypothetical protein
MAAEAIPEDKGINCVQAEGFIRYVFAPPLLLGIASSLRFASRSDVKVQPVIAKQQG